MKSGREQKREPGIHSSVIVMLPHCFGKVLEKFVSVKKFGS